MMRGREARLRRSSISWSPTRLHLVDMNRGPACEKQDTAVRIDCRHNGIEAFMIRNGVIEIQHTMPVARATHTRETDRGADTYCGTPRSK